MDNETVGDVFNTMNEKQKKVLYMFVGYVVEMQRSKSDFDKFCKEFKDLYKEPQSYIIKKEGQSLYEAELN